MKEYSRNPFGRISESSFGSMETEPLGAATSTGYLLLRGRKFFDWGPSPEALLFSNRNLAPEVTWTTCSIFTCVRGAAQGCSARRRRAGRLISRPSCVSATDLCWISCGLVSATAPSWLSKSAPANLAEIHRRLGPDGSGGQPKSRSNEKIVSHTWSAGTG
jgi:hypothetical protein